jgi:MGT family glycosyltransferase
MTHFGIICPPAIGHLNPMCALGRELQRRGHQVTVLGIPDIQAKVLRSRLDFWTIGEAEFPAGILEQNAQQLGKMSRLAGLNFTIQLLEQEAKLLLYEVPGAIASTGIEALLVDQVSAAGGTVADFLNLPFITVCNALLVNREAGVPPYFTPWQYRDAGWARLRNRIGNAAIDRLTQPIRQVIVEQRRQWQLPSYSNNEDFYSQLAQICQLPAEFDFPRVNLAKCFHYLGPFQEPSGLEPIAFPSIPFPFEKLTGKPLIYASLGTLQNRQLEIFDCIAQACVGLNVQLVISLGNPSDQGSLPNLPGSPIVVAYAPHQQLIDRASLVVTHGGMNTTLGALSSGVPLIAIPITNEQPGIAARIARIRVGEMLPLRRLNVPRLRAAIEQVLTEAAYKQNALRLQAAIRQAGGVRKGADIIEQVVTTGKPALS